MTKKKATLQPLYDTDLSIKEKITVIAKEIYGAADVVFEPSASKQIAQIESLGFGQYACMYGQESVFFV